VEVTPCIVQDSRTGEVLTLAYVNDESLRRTRATGEMWFWSRSREKLWHKGETSGNVQRLKALRYDCDNDAFVALVEPAGPACHTGQRTCFYRGEMDPTPAEALPALERTIAERRSADPEASYTARLLAEPAVIGTKVEEEAEEAARAARDEPDERVAEEAADVLYHLAVLMAARDLSLTDAYEVLNERRRAARPHP
jgi:phosphoribosyl-AMP cyclohydrolase / phosphoribosyl-ATP pyrophosphohydrolase